MRNQVSRGLVVTGALLANALLLAEQAIAAPAEADPPAFFNFIPLILLIAAIWWFVKRTKKQSASNAVQSEGAKPNKQISLAVKVLLVLGGIALLGKIIDSGESNGNSSVPTATASASANPVSAMPQWKYSHEEDQMSKGYKHYAWILSTNTVNFEFPYQGEQHGTLTLRTWPDKSKDVILSMEKGQFLCRSYEACTVHVRFDDEDAMDFSGRGPSDNSTETVFIYDYEKFVGKMAKAKRVRIATTVYQAGAPVFDFNVAGFDASKYVPAK